MIERTDMIDCEHGGSAQPRAAMRVTISPGSAWRCVLDFSKSGVPSIVTSKRPPLEGMSFTSAAGNFPLISAARPAARGS